MLFRQFLALSNGFEDPGPGCNGPFGSLLLEKMHHTDSERIQDDSEMHCTDSESKNWQSGPAVECAEVSDIPDFPVSSRGRTSTAEVTLESFAYLVLPVSTSFCCECHAGERERYE